MKGGYTKSVYSTANERQSFQKAYRDAAGFREGTEGATNYQTNLWSIELISKKSSIDNISFLDL